MSVETTTRKTTQSMTILLIDYTFSFRALLSAPTDIKCTRTNTATNTDEDMEYVSEIPAPSDATDVLKYMVDINDDGVGGSVKVMWPSTGSTITIYRETTDVQSSDYEDFNQFPANTVETDFDKRTMKSQEQQEELNRTLKYGVTSPTGSTLPAGEADTYLGWNAAGTLLENKTLPDPSTLVKSTAADAIAHTNDTTYMTPYTTYAGIKTMGTINVLTTATIAHAIVTTLTATTITMSNSSINAERSKGMTVETPGGAEDISMFYSDKDLTIDKIVCILTGTTPSVTWGINHGADRSGAGTSVVTGTTADLTSGSTITAFADATVPSNSHIWFVTTATSGTIDSLNIMVKYKQDA